MTDQKIKTAADKPPLNLVPQASLIGPSRVAEHGAVKYARGNWHTADDVMGIADRYMGGVLRHGVAMQNANGTYDMMSIGKLDDESGLPEIDHMIMGLLMLRGLAIKYEFMPADPGVSRLIKAAAPPAAQLELPLDAPAPTPRPFKVGDRVRTVNIKPPTIGKWCGRSGVITHDRSKFTPDASRGFNVKIDDDGKDGCNCVVAFASENLELLGAWFDAPAVPKAGDRVRIVEATHRAHNVGKVGVLLEERTGTQEAPFKVNTGGPILWATKVEVVL